MINSKGVCNGIIFNLLVNYPQRGGANILSFGETKSMTSFSEFLIKFSNNWEAYRRKKKQNKAVTLF